MSDCLHKYLIRISQSGTDGFPIYYCESCRELFKVKPEEIMVELPASADGTKHSVCPKLEDVVPLVAGDNLWERCLSLVEQCRNKTPDKWDFAYKLEQICKQYHVEQASQPVREDQQPPVQALRELVAKVSPTVEFYLKREINSPANHQQFQQEAQENLDAWHKLESLLPRESGGRE